MADMRQLIQISVLLLALGLTPQPAQADERADPFTCMATRAAELRHLGPVSTICTGFAVEHCMAQTDWAVCLATIPARREDYVQSMLSQFPEDAEDLAISSLAKRRYLRNLQELHSGTWRDEVTMDPQDCAELSAPQEICDVIEAMQVVDTVEHWAEILGLSWTDA